MKSLTLQGKILLTVITVMFVTMLSVIAQDAFDPAVLQNMDELGLIDFIIKNWGKSSSWILGSSFVLLGTKLLDMFWKARTTQSIENKRVVNLLLSLVYGFFCAVILGDKWYLALIKAIFAGFSSSGFYEGLKGIFKK